ncbi:MAG: GreA/GreB family elongation factor [Candidatus Roizmanbacteria bacterium]|nr:GreA/GreB family elongation factor [Candidatus Roizmanbacteria bacterium]
MTQTVTYMTQGGFDTISNEYEDLKAKRPEYVKKLTQAADMGDRSENAAYSNAKRKLRSTDSKLRFLKKVIDHTKVAIPSQTEYVEIGSQVLVNFNDREFTMHIVGLHEADPSKMKVSYRSPVGSALMGKKVGEMVKIQLEDRVIEYKVLGIFIKPKLI